MKISIVYHSNTGNTYALAEAMRCEIAKHDLVYFGEPPKRLVDAELYVVGSYTNNGICSAEISEYLKKLEGKKTAYFFTAGFGDSKEYFSSICTRVKSIFPPTNKILGFYFCPGKMPGKVRDDYVAKLTQNPDDAKTKLLLSNFDKVASHPNQDDIAGAKLWIRKTIEQAGALVRS